MKLVLQKKTSQKFKSNSVQATLDMTVISEFDERMHLPYVDLGLYLAGTTASSIGSAITIHKHLLVPSSMTNSRDTTKWKRKYQIDQETHALQQRLDNVRWFAAQRSVNYNAKMSCKNCFQSKNDKNRQAEIDKSQTFQHKYKLYNCKV